MISTQASPLHFVSPRMQKLTPTVARRLSVPQRCVRTSSAHVELASVNDETWDNIVQNSPVPVLVDFWAPHCGGCRALFPILGKVAAEYDGRLAVVKYNTTESSKMAMQHGLRSTPTVMVFRAGEKVDTIVGMHSSSEIIQTIQKHL